MEFTDYILEAAGVSDVDIMDIEVTQAMAEMAVLEAMMDCYEKQMVLLEYNEDAANEIFSESYVITGMDNFYLEAAKDKKNKDKNKDDNKPTTGAKADNLSENKNAKAGTKEDKVGNAVKIVNSEGRYVFAYNEPKGIIIPTEIFSFDSESVAKNNKKLLDAKMKAKGDGISALKKHVVGDKNGIAVYLTKDLGITSWKYYGGYVRPNGTIATGEDPRNFLSQNAQDKAAELKVKNGKSAATDIAANNKAATFKKWLNKAFELLQSFVGYFLDLFRNVRFDQLANRVRKSSKGQTTPFELTMQEMNSISFLNNIKDFTSKVALYLSYIEDQTAFKKWNEAEAEKQLMLFKTSIEDYRLAQRKGDNAVGAGGEDRDRQVTPEELANKLDELHKKRVYDDIAYVQKLFRKSATTYNVNSNVPDRIYKGVRTAINLYVAEFREAVKTVKKLVSAVVSKEDMNVSSRGTQVIAKNPSDMIAAEKQVDKDLKQARQNGWAEEGWSMNLSEDEDFF